MERSGLIAAAVRPAGYASEENSEVEGSSVDAEEEIYEDADETHPPSYSHPRDLGIELGHVGSLSSLARHSKREYVLATGRGSRP